MQPVRRRGAGERGGNDHHPGAAVEQVDAENYRVTGDLTIKDVTKPVTIEFEQTGSARDPFGNVRVGFEGETTINRKDWGLTWNMLLDAGGLLVSKEITLEIEVELIHKPSLPRPRQYLTGTV